MTVSELIYRLQLIDDPTLQIEVPGDNNLADFIWADKVEVVTTVPANPRLHLSTNVRIS